MSITTIPTRTSADSNASADINTLMTNIANVYASLGGGGDMPFAEIDIPSGAWNYPTSNPAPLDRDTGTNGTILRQLFDDTTEEFIETIFQVPQDITTGDVTFEAWGYSVTAAADKFIQLKVYHVPLADSESWDSAYGSKVSGDLATDSTQDDLDKFSWTETVTNLGWGAGEFVRVKLSRVAPSGTNLSGDWGLTHFRIRIPRA
jgi:hypothetical protein